jgi:FkbM family methyltransferase
MWRALSNLQKNGFRPNTVVDVGAHRGEWSKQAATIFREPRFCMIEADPSQRDVLTQIAGQLENRAIYREALVGAAPRGATTFFQMGSGSSIYAENTTFPRERLSLEMTTLDLLLDQEDLDSPVFLKLDVQGAELDVLEGAPKLLEQTEVVLLEASLIEYNATAPLFAEVVAWMRARSFLVYDLCGGLRRQSDGALFQLDVIFVRESSDLRKPRQFWTAEP